MKTDKKCPNCNDELILVTASGALNNQDQSKWPLICKNCELVFDQKLKQLKEKTKIFKNMMMKKRLIE